MKTANKPDISAHLLWEFDFEKFNFEKSYKIVIERVLERGKLKEWEEMMKFYTKKQIKETLNWSKQLKDKDKNFALLFIKSDYFDVS